MLQVRICCDENRERVALGSVKQFAVLQLRPTAFVCSGYFVRHEGLPQRDRSALVKQYSHLSRGQGASRGMFQNGANLVERDTRKPLHELRDQRTVFKVLEQRCDRHAGSTEYPGSAHPLRIPLNRGAGRPVNHE